MTIPLKPRLLAWWSSVDRLLILRGIAALTVVNYHSQDAFRQTLKPLIFLKENVSWIAMANGGMAVRVFFTLSGFLMFKAFYTDRYKLGLRHLPRFYRARLRRIVPLYYFLCLIFVVLVYPAVLRPENRGTLLSALTFTYSGNTSTPFAVPFWSLSTEMEFYLLVPLFVLLAKRFITGRWQAIAALGLVITLGGLSRWAAMGHKVSTLLNFTTSLDAFLIGGIICIFLYGPHVKKRRKPSLTANLLIGLALFPIISAYAYSSKLSTYEYFIFGPTVTVLLTAFFIFTSEDSEETEYNKAPLHLGYVLRRPSLWFTYIGALSYGIYLWHMPILSQIQNVHLISGTGWKAMVTQFIVVTLLATVCSIWTYRYIENRPVVKEGRL